MIISFNGDEGSGKSTIAKKVAETLGMTRYYMGQIFRDMAAKRGLTLLEYVKTGENDPGVDKEVDGYMYQLSQKEDNFVIESRTAFHIIPTALKIYLKVDEREGARRVYADLQKKNDRNEIKNPSSLEDVLINIRNRRNTDETRYKKYYNINIRDERHYDLVLDTTNLSIEEVFQKVIEFIRQRK